MSLLTSFRIKTCYAAALLVCLAIFGLAYKGLHLGLDFTGGYLSEIETHHLTAQSSISQTQMQQSLADIGLTSAVVNTDSLNRPNSVNNFANTSQRWTLRLPDNPDQAFDTQQIESLSEALNTQITLLDSFYISASVGSELLEHGGLALLVAAIAVLVYLAMRFEWRLALAALVALFHDVLIVLGLFAWLGLSFDLATMAAVLAIIGYSLNDSIVIGDRIRELLHMKQTLPLDQTVDLAIKSTFTRTLVTSGTTIVTIAAIWMLAGNPLESFSIALFVGVIAGSISSISISATLPGLLGLDASHYQRQEEDFGDTLP